MMNNNHAGFTLVELMVSMTIGLIVIAGVMGIFVSQSKVQSSETSRIEMIADLQLASQIIRSELHFAQDVYTDCSKKVFYQPMDSATGFPPSNGCSNALVKDGSNKFINGRFELRPPSQCTSGAVSSTPGCVFWCRPNMQKCDELIRNIKASTGLQASSDVYGVYQVDLYGQYRDMDHLQHDLATRITVWPRNQ